ncbi:MAG: hypothetical protein JSV77_03810 [Dehalococcoidales bacterium]|nr:MAG: hypothetical protein JSV77_03810 [Dehalococcoidales bacterium]
MLGMHAEQQVLFWIIIAGGALVITSYTHGFLTHPNTRGNVWGGIPARLKPLYVVSMLLAAAGFFAFTYFVLWRLNPGEVVIAKSFGFTIFIGIYIVILVPSAMWMPLTFAMLTYPSEGLWLRIRVTLALVGVASLALLIILLTLNTREPAVAYWFAVGGAAAFCLQTAVLDMLVWPAFFKV